MQFREWLDTAASERGVTVEEIPGISMACEGTAPWGHDAALIVADVHYWDYAFRLTGRDGLPVIEAMATTPQSAYRLADSLFRELNPTKRAE
jgi:hypothetical protein